jgi:hypothetical protein
MFHANGDIPAAKPEGISMRAATLPVAPETDRRRLPRAERRKAGTTVVRALGLGLAVTLLQILLACLFSGQADWPAAYQSLFQWDSGWYSTFVEHGYFSPPTLTRQDHGNVSFLPAYPLAASLLRRATGWTPCLSLLVTAQLAAWGFWTYLFLLLGRCRLPTPLAVLATLLIASHPAAFFLVAGYTESLFLCSLLGFLYWSDEGSGRGLCLAALHGLVLTATRLVGLPVVVYPLLRCRLDPSGPIPAGPWPRLRRYLPALATAAFASLGAGLFFLYCRCRFGQWDLFQKSQFAGWRASANHLAFFSWRTYCPEPPFLRDGFLNPVWFSQFAVPFTVLMAAVLLVLEYRRRGSPAGQGWRARAGWYACAALMFYISVCGNATTGMYSMVRYLLPIDVLLTLAVVHWLSQAHSGSRGPWFRYLMTTWIGISFLLQAWLTYRFTHAQWVA